MGLPDDWGAEDAEKVTSIYTSKMQNITLYAKWEKIEYTITFNTNGGSELTSFKVPENTTIDKFAVTTKEGYTFDGWYLDAGCVAKFNSLTVKSNLTLYVSSGVSCL